MSIRADRIERRHRISALAAAAFSLVIIPAHAIIFYSTDDPAYNTTPPAGALTDSGWQFQGIWGGFLGTPIAPKYFITAKHVGGSIGDNFVFDGVPHATTAVFDDPETDLRIWRVCGTFPRFAPIYTNSDEQNKSLVVFGRGTQRGMPVTTSGGLFGSKTNGWQWGPYDDVQRWGENVVAGIVDGNGLFGSGIGELLQADFGSNGGPNECHLSTGDSAGALFIKDGATWKIAGINYAVDGPYNTTNSGPGFNAAIFDEGGLYKGGEGNWVLTPDLPANQAGSFYSTRISARAGWVNSVLSAPIPALQSSATVSGPYADVPGATVDDNVQTITIPQPGQSEFYRLRSCSSLRIKSIQVQGSNLVLTYE